MGAERQKILILYLASSALDTRVVGWAEWDGTGASERMPGDCDDPPYATGLEALRDGWRLLQISPLIAHAPGDEFSIGYLKYEFLFEKLVELA